MGKALFIRHGETNYNLLGFCNSSGPEVFLTEKGIAQAKEAGEKLTHLTFDLIFVSPTHRTKETLSYLQAKGPMALEDKRITELKTNFEGRPIKEYLSLVKEDPISGKIEGGESVVELYTRVKDFIESLPKDKTVLVITHSMIMKCLKVYHQNLAISQIDSIDLPKNGEILEIELK